MISKILSIIGKVIATIIVIPFIIILWATLAVIYSLALLCVLIGAIFCDIWGIETESL